MSYIKVVSKSQDTRGQAKNLRIHEYFYGTAKSQLYPHSIEVGFNEVKIFKIGAPQLPDSLLPVGMKAEDNFTKIFPISPCIISLLLFPSIIIFRFQMFVNFVILAPVLLNHLLSVSHANSVDDDSDRSSLVETNIAGYLVVYANRILFFTYLII